MDISSRPTKSRKIILGVIIPIGVLCLVLLGFLWYRQRRKNPLLEEMEKLDTPASDVPIRPFVLPSGGSTLSANLPTFKPYSISSTTSSLAQFRDVLPGSSSNVPPLSRRGSIPFSMSEYGTESKISVPDLSFPSLPRRVASVDARLRGTVEHGLPS